MKWLLLGALLGLLLVFPSLLGLVVAASAAVLAKPVLVAFGLGLAVRTRLPRLRRRVR
ncbi:hypothetical protein [Streptomyces sp. RLB3-6]|uniref:hypothetical protein n=1 Tax=Streptomyces sp. RLB3-6 TaxID=2594457 RepID=UPI001967B260|nr:hypothetical protein [Streptomyces sp. RLB3-6]